MTFKEIIEHLINEILPCIESNSANKKVKTIIETIENNLQPDIPNTATILSLQEEYERALKIKDKLEDKAKSTIFAITIATTLIMGSSNIINELSKNTLNNIISIFASAIFILTVVYMIVAGKLSLELLMEKNIFYYVSAQQKKKQKDIKIEYYNSNQCNNSYNIIRNNLINSAFKCIRNAMVCLFIVFITLILSKLFTQTTSTASSFLNFIINVHY